MKIIPKVSWLPNNPYLVFYFANGVTNRDIMASYHNNRIFLSATNIETTKELFVTLIHEILHHLFALFNLPISFDKLLDKLDKF